MADFVNLFREEAESSNRILGGEINIPQSEYGAYTPYAPVSRAFVLNQF